MACSVRGCEEQATEPLRLGGPRMLMLEWPVCEFHAQAIKGGGESWSLNEDDREILLGSQGAHELLDFKVVTDVWSHTVTLSLGHDGVEEQSVTFRMKPSDARSICLWVGSGKHNFDGSLPDEGTAPGAEDREKRIIL